jgi:hypothetical protein
MFNKNLSESTTASSNETWPTNYAMVALTFARGCAGFSGIIPFVNREQCRISVWDTNDYFGYASTAFAEMRQFKV